MKIEFSSQSERRNAFVPDHQYGCRDVTRKRAIYLVRAFHKLLGNFLQHLVFEAPFFVSSNLLHSQQFLLLSSNSEISERLLVLKLAFLPYFAIF